MKIAGLARRLARNLDEGIKALGLHRSALKQPAGCFQHHACTFRVGPEPFGRARQEEGSMILVDDPCRDRSSRELYLRELIARQADE